MTPSILRVTQSETEAPDTPDYLWKVAGKPVCVRIPFTLMDRLGDEVEESFGSLNSRGSELGGVLFGRVIPARQSWTGTNSDPATVCVEDYAVVACDHTGGPLYQLSRADLVRLDGVIAARTASGVQAVGFFRSHARRGLSLGPEDVGLMRSRFRDPASIALLVRPSVPRTRTAAVFIWEDGRIQSESSHLEFPFHSLAQTSGKLLHEVPAQGSGSRLVTAAPPANAAGAQVVPITSRMELTPPPAAPPVELPEEPASTAAQESLRISLAGMMEKEASALAKVLVLHCRATIVKDRSYNVLLVDTATRDATRILRERVADAVIVIVSNGADREMPGTVTLRRPLAPEIVGDVFAEVSKLVAGRAAPLPPQAVRAPRGSKPLAFTSLYDLAAAYRTSLSKGESFVVNIEEHRYSLYPGRHLFKSNYSPTELRSLRGNMSLAIDVSRPADAISGDGSLGLSLQRLEEFLWHLGFNAGVGTLLPWMGDQHSYRLSRWPPVVRKDNDSTLVKLATLMAMARRTLRPDELAQTTGISPYIIADFLNGCSLVGCLEEFTVPPEMAPAKARPKHPLLKLLGRIRLKLGLT
ncbi:MAG TPA: hypothetical protein VKU19_25060 [Bryobacteraceae bacterium]|nr:hypothetical protein [Bryobacteraceae bacterium]